MGADFSPEQKRWLEGFASGVAALGGRPSGGGSGEPTGPDALGFNAQDQQVAAGGKLADPEKWKRADPPFEAYRRLRAEALEGKKPTPDDNFRWRFHGLFWVAPAQDGYMCRMRVPNGILTHWQFAAVADLIDRHSKGRYAHVTTRANLQARELPPEEAPLFIEGLAEIGIIPKGTGADNIRNVTGSAAAGIDPQELLDTRPYAKAWNHHLLNTREMMGLPRKFNVAFDGGGIVPTLEDTNDIGFQAVEVIEGAPVEPGVWFRLALGGITGHKDLARDTGVVLKPADATKVADAIIRVFAENGKRTDRNKSRMKYVLDEWGFEKYLAAVEDKLGEPLARVDPTFVKPRPAHDRLAHLGIWPQKQPGLNWIGVVLPVGRMSTDEMRGLASIAREDGDGDIRMTVWQNLMISGVPDAKLDAVKAKIEAIGLDWRPNSIRAGLVACTGSWACRFGAADTKATAMTIAEEVAPKLSLDAPVNIHLTGCHNSCAQHYIGDIGLIGAKVPVGEDGDTVEGFDMYVGGGFGNEGAIGRLLYKDVVREEVPARVEKVLRAYMGSRLDATETFQAFTARHEVDDLTRMVEGTP